MDVTGFSFVSLGSSTVQLHDSLGSRRACSCSEAGFSSQKGDRVWGVYYRRAAFCCAFLWAKELNAKDIHKEIFLFMVGSVSRIKRSTTGWQKLFWWWRGWNGGAEVAETTAKILLCCGFRTISKVRGQVYQILEENMARNKYFSPGSDITSFTFYIHLSPIHWLSLVFWHRIFK
jgi:hypothetical protein